MMQRRNVEVVETVPREDRVTQVVYFLISLVQVVLLFRLILRLFGASPAAGFVEFIYDVTAPLVAPFFGIFRSDFDFAQGVLEIETLVAMLVYAVVGYLLLALIDIIRTR
ncbi:MAG: YggT family protein [Candidatus Saccharimonadales bacterium]